MKKILYFSFTLIILLLAGNAVLFYKYKQLKVYHLSLVDKYNELSTKQLRIASVLKENNVVQRMTEAMSCPDITLVDPGSKRNRKISDLLQKDAPLLFFRFRETDCNACVQQALELLKDIAVRFPEQKIVVLSGYKNVRQFYAYAGNESKEFKVYNVNEFPILPDNYDKPYFFVLNKNMELRDIFFYVKEETELNMDYLNCIIRKHWGKART